MTFDGESWAGDGVLSVSRDKSIDNLVQDRRRINVSDESCSRGYFSTELSVTKYLLSAFLSLLLLLFLTFKP